MSYRWWVLVAVGLFVLGMTLGLALPDDSAEILAGDLTALVEAFRFDEILAWTGQSS